MTDEEFEERRCLLKMLGYSVVKDECLGFLFYVPEHPVPSYAFSTERWAWTAAWKNYKTREERKKNV